MPHAHNGPVAIIGNLNVDLWVGPVERFPAWDEELVVDSARLELAGTAGYALLACSALGMDPFVVSTIGTDVFGRFIQASLAETGADASGVEVIKDEETCLGMIFVDQTGRRGILATLGAHRHMSVEVARRHDERVRHCPDVFLCGAYLLPRFSPEHLLEYARELRERGQRVSFDPSWDPAGWSAATRASTLTLLDEVDVYLPNEQELLALTEEDDWRVALRMVKSATRETVLKRGADGAVYVRGDEWLEVPAPAVAAVNTIGAGDVFNVAYLHALRAGLEPADRLRFACGFAAHVVSQPDARTYPSWEETWAFIATHEQGTKGG